MKTIQLFVPEFKAPDLWQGKPEPGLNFIGFPLELFVALFLMERTSFNDLSRDGFQDAV
jgi:hypothetical protein